jgi:hypothetical protein
MIPAGFGGMASTGPPLPASSRPEHGANLTMRLVEEGRPDDLPTPRSMVRTNFRGCVWCKACRYAKDAGLGAPIAAGRGEVAGGGVGSDAACYPRCHVTLPGPFAGAG